MREGLKFNLTLFLMKLNQLFLIQWLLSLSFFKLSKSNKKKSIFKKEKKRKKNIELEIAANF
jgi:hypothetical protein